MCDNPLNVHFVLYEFKKVKPNLTMNECVVYGMKNRICSEDADLYENRGDPDCVFVVQNEEIRAHKLVLACCSEVFDKMLYGSLAASEIIITDITPEDFKQVLEFVYNDRVRIRSVNHAWTLIYAAAKYFLDDLVKICSDYIAERLTLSTVLMCYELSEFYNVAHLKNKCWDIIVNYTKGIFEYDYHIKWTTWVDILSSSVLNIDEKDLVSYVIKWTLDECKLRNLNFNKNNIWEILNESEISNYFQLPFISPKDHKKSFAELLKETDFSKIDLQRNKRLAVTQLMSKLYVTGIAAENCTIRKREHPLSSFILRRWFKIYKKFVLSTNEVLTTGLYVSRKIALFGVSISTEHEHDRAAAKTYNGSFTVFVEKEIQEHKFVLLQKYVEPYRELHYDKVFRIPFDTHVILEPNIYYRIGVKYHTLTPEKRVEVMCLYGDDIKTNLVTVTFLNELQGSAVQGLSFFPV